MEGIKIGIGRVSTTEQNPQRQIDAFLKEGIEERYIFIDKCTGNGGNLDKRENYQRAKAIVRKGDVVFLDALDRLHHAQGLHQPHIHLGHVADTANESFVFAGTDVRRDLPLLQPPDQAVDLSGIGVLLQYDYHLSSPCLDSPSCVKTKTASLIFGAGPLANLQVQPPFKHTRNRSGR
jgi:hypothetical protein